MPESDVLDRTARLRHAAGLLHAATDEQQVIAILRDHARGIAACDSISIVQREGDDIVCIAEDSDTPTWIDMRCHMSLCFSGLALQSSEPALVPDIRNDPRVPLNAYLSTFAESMAMFPMGRSIALGTFWRSAGPIDPATVALVGELGDAARPILHPGWLPTRQAS